MDAMIRTQGRRDGLLRGLGRPAAAAILLALAVLLAWPETARAQNAGCASTIGGSPKVGNTMTVDNSTICDRDGLSNASFSYQWRADDTAISGATSETYTIQSAQLGQILDVAVSFTDNAGNAETVLSLQTVRVLAAGTPNQPPPTGPDAGRINILFFGDKKKPTVNTDYMIIFNVPDVVDPDGPGNLRAARGLDTSFTWLVNGERSDNVAWRCHGFLCRLRAHHAGKVVTVKFTFTDSEGVKETITSEPTETVRWRLAAFGEPTITGLYRVGDTLTADYSEIIDLDGYDTTSFTYQWLADDVAISSATSKTYTLTAAEQGKRIKVRASFTDNAGDSETRTSAQTGAVRAAGTENVPATGTPTVGGTVRPGLTATANTGGISDSDGLTRPRYRYQWLADGMVISGATSKTFELKAAQLGTRISVRVTFTDDGGSVETSTSPQTEAALGGSPPEGAPDITGRSRVGDTLTANTDGISDSDGMERSTFTYQWLAGGVAISSATSGTYTLAAAQQGKRISVRVTFEDDGGTTETLTSPATGKVLAAATANQNPTGRPTISGTVRVGQTLSTNTAGIADADGLTRPRYVYQWLADDAVISGQTAKEYTVTSSDAGKRLKVRVNFTDDGGTVETLTSEAVVVSTASAGDVRLLDDRLHIFRDGKWGTVCNDGLTRRRQLAEVVCRQLGRTGGEIVTHLARDFIYRPHHMTEVNCTGAETRLENCRFSTDIRCDHSSDVGVRCGDAYTNQAPVGLPTITETARVGQTLTADTSEISDPDGPEELEFAYQWRADGVAISGATSETYTLAAAEQGKRISVRVTFTDDGGTVETSTSSQTAAASGGSLPEGAPDITGRSRVGDTLTAITGRISDADGVKRSTFTYEWRADGVAVSGATSRTYTLVAAQQGKRIKVRVTFEDDGGTTETLTSPATGTVLAAGTANQNPTGLPTISGTVKAGQTLSTNTGGIADADGLTRPRYVYQWLADDAAISGRTAKAYTVTSSEVGKRLKVRVNFTDDGGTVETLTSEATVAVPAAVASAGDVRLLDDRLHIFQDSAWGTVCDDGLNSTTGRQLAEVVCRQLGQMGGEILYNLARDLIYRPHHMTEVKCTGAETRLDDCPFSTDIRCDHSSDVGVRCTAETTPTVPANQAPVGLPTITGTAQVGQMLTADTSEISDPDGPEELEFTYQWLAAGSAISTATAATYTIQATDLNKSLTVQVSFTDDGGTVETLTSAETSAVAENVQESTTAVTVSFRAVSPAPAAVEGGSKAVVAVDVTPAPNGAVLVPIMATGSDGAGAGDFTISPTTLTFSSSDTSRNVTVTAVDDQVDDDGETVTLGFGTLPSNASIVRALVTTVTVGLTDNDERGVVVSASSVRVLEGGSASYTVALDTEPTGTVTVRVTTDLSGTDVTVSPAALTFTAANWGTAQALTVSAEEDDGDALDDDPVTLTHAVSGGDYGSETASSVTVTITENDRPSVSIADASGGESAGSLGFAVSLDIPSSKSVTVGYATADDTAAAGTDYTASSGTLTFAAGATGPQTITVEVTEDEVDEGEGETFTVALRSPVNAVLGDASAEGNIEDDDERGVVVSEESVTVSEGGSASYTVVLESEPTGAVTVRVTTDLSGTDVTVSPAALTFTAATWRTAQTVAVSAEEDDGDALDDDPVTLTHAVSGGDYGSETASSVTVTITENDEPSVSIADASGGESAGPLGFAVSLDIPSSKSVTVGYATADDTAAAGTDYTASSGTLTFAAGATGPQTITVEVTEDGVDEGEGETFTVALTSPANAVLGDASAEGNIEDDDERGVVVSEESVTVSEGGSASYTVVLESEPTGAVTVRVTTDLSGTDVTVSPAALTFTAANWQTAQALTVSAEEDDDAASEPEVTLSHEASGGDYGGESVAGVLVMVIENDVSTLAVADAAGVESDGVLRFEVSLSLASSDAVTVEYATADGTAEAGTDYTAASGTVTFAAGTAGTQTIEVTVTDDEVDEALEAFTLELSNAMNAQVGDASAKGSIEDDDERGVAVSEERVTVPEGESASYTVVLASQPTADVTVTVTVPSGTDVTVSPAALTFTAANWSEAQTVAVSAAEDDGDALDDLEVALEHAVSGGDYGGETVPGVSVAVEENDRPEVSIAGAGVAEGAGVVRFAVRLNIPSSREVTVNYATADRTAEAGADYTAVSGAVTFAAGETERVVEVSIADDQVDEDPADGAVAETFTVTLSGPSASAELGEAASAEGSIEDDDERGVSLSRGRLTVTEGRSESYTVVLGSKPVAEVTVTVRVPSGAGVTVRPGRLTFTPANWSEAQRVTVSGVEDENAVAEPAVTLAHGASGGDYEDETVAGVLVTVIETDVSTLVIAAASGLESAGVLGFVVSLSAASDRAVTVDYATVDGTAEAGTDYAAASGTLTFAAGATEAQRIAVTIVNDDEDEVATETFTVTLSNASSNAVLGVANATGTIEDEDETVAPNTPPRVVRDIEQQGLTAGGEPAAVDVSGVFEDAEGDELTYTASSANPGVATVSVSGTTVTVSAVGAGRAQVTVTATDAEGTNTEVSQSFVAVVSLAVGAVEVTPAAGGGAVVVYAGATGPVVRIEVPAGAGGTSRLDTDGDGDLDVEDNLPTVRAVTETEVPEVPTALRVRVDRGSAVDIELPEEATAGGAVVRVCLATSLDGEGLTLYRYDAEAGEWQGLESTVEQRGEQRFVCAEVGDFSVFVVFQERELVADVNGDGEVSGDDALVMYYVYTLENLLEVERYRRTLLGGRAGRANPNPSDADLVEMVRKAKAWRDAGAAAGGDVNGDGEVSGDDALVMYYVYTLENLLEVERYRRTLLGGRAGRANPNPSDADLVEMVRKAKALRDAAG